MIKKNNGQAQRRAIGGETSVLFVDKINFDDFSSEVVCAADITRLLKRAVKSAVVPKDLRSKVLTRLKFS